MAALSAVQVAQLARGAGLTDPEDVATAVAVAGFAGSPNPGESGGRPDAIGDTRLVDGTWGPSVGLWQIRSLHAERGTGGVRDQDRLTDPAFNARSMVAIRRSARGWAHWSVYTSGAYRANLPAAREAAGAAGSPGAAPVGSPAPGGRSGPAAVLYGLQRLGDGSWWRRIGWGALGVLVVILGLVLAGLELGPVRR